MGLSQVEHLKNQIISLKALDALVVLGGEAGDCSRTNHAFCLYSTGGGKKRRLPLVLTGHDSGFKPNYPMQSEAEAMRGFLSSLGVEDSDMFTEPEGRDTLANIVLSTHLLRRLEAKKIGLITDDYHMARAMWTARRVWGSSINVTPLPTTKTTNFFGKVVERAVLSAQRYDLWRAGIHQGDQEGFEKYLREQHPFHAPLQGNRPAFGAYMLGVYALGLFK